jgi:hypothetical protein
LAAKVIKNAKIKMLSEWLGLGAILRAILIDGSNDVCGEGEGDRHLIH